MQKLIEYIASSLVDDPSQVQVTETKHGSKYYLSLQVAQEDMGRVIGKRGRVANAMRLLLNVLASKEGRQASLDVEDPR